MKVLSFLLGIVLFTSQVWGATYYIDPTCGSSGDGTTTTCGSSGPFKTWAEVSWAAGNTYSQKGGTTVYGTITVGASGTAGNVITINSYGAGNAILNGGVTIDPASWTANDPVSGVYSHPSDDGYNYPKLEDNIFLQEATTANCTNGNTARPYIIGSGTKYYYKPTTGTPSEHTFEEIRYVGINLQGYDYISISGFSFTKFVNSISGYDFGNGHQLSNSNIIIANNSFSNSQNGVALGNYASNGLSNITVTSNSFSYQQTSVELHSYGGCDAGTTTQYNSGVAIAANTITYCSQVYTPGGPAKYQWPSVNRVSGGPGNYQDMEGIGIQDLINSNIYGNSITGMCRGLYLFTCNSKSSYNDNIYSNYIKTTGTPIILNPDTLNSPGAKYQYNINIYNNILSGGGSDGYNTTMLLGNTKTPSKTYNSIYNNTIIGAAQAILFQSYSNYFNIKNNIIYGATNYPVLIYGDASNIVFDYNLYSTYANGFYVNGVTYTYNNWKALGANFDAHSPTIADPLFTNAVGGVYTLKSSSPAKWGGANVGLKTDYAGKPAHNPPSIGAYEYSLNPAAPSMPTKVQIK